MRSCQRIDIQGARPAARRFINIRQELQPTLLNGMWSEQPRGVSTPDDLMTRRPRDFRRKNCFTVVELYNVSRASALPNGGIQYRELDITK